MFIKKNKNIEHSFFMELALKQAQKVLGNTKENPAVGCLIVNNNSAISAAHTSLNGRPHAEFNAINFSKFDLKNSSIYVTLEPCSHYGKTPPCTNIIVKKKFKSVVFSVKDPDLRSFDKSTKLLKKSKISVKSGILNSKNFNFYRSYFSVKKKGIPFITGKMAISKDYYTANKKRKWITNTFSRGRAHYLRSTHDCILTSAKTVLMDNPKLTCRIPGMEVLTPSRFVIDKKLEIPINSNLLRYAYKHKTFIFFNSYKKSKISNLKKKKAKLIRLPLDKKDNFDIKNILKIIKDLGYSRILLECGVKLTEIFFRENLINDFYLFISKNKIKKMGCKSFKNETKVYLKNKKSHNEKVNLFGDKLIVFRIK